MSYDETEDAEALRDAAERRWPLAVSSRIDHRYPVSALYEFSREAFVEGAAWQRQRTGETIRESGALIMAEAAGDDGSRPLVSLLTTVDVLSKRWAAMTVRVSELQATVARVRAFAEERAKVADPALAASVGYAECAADLLRILEGDA